MKSGKRGGRVNVREKGKTHRKKKRRSGPTRAQTCSSSGLEDYIMSTNFVNLKSNTHWKNRGARGKKKKPTGVERGVCGRRDEGKKKGGN